MEGGKFMADGAFYDGSVVAAPTLVESLSRYIGETVTLFTTSGGLSGTGITGVLVAVTPCYVKIITQIAAPPSCPLGSSCTGPVAPFGGGFGCFGGRGYGYGGYTNFLGSVSEIPIDRIASFTHNAI